MLLLAGCAQKEKILLEADTVRVTRTGNLTSVCDLVGDETYTFRAVRKPRAEATERRPRLSQRTPSPSRLYPAAVSISCPAGAIILFTKEVFLLE